MQKEETVYKYPETIDTRVALLEKSVNSIEQTLIRLENKIDKRFDVIDRKFETVDKKFDLFESKFNSQFRWIMGSIFGIYISIMGVTLTTLAKSLHWF